MIYFGINEIHEEDKCSFRAAHTETIIHIFLECENTVSIKNFAENVKEEPIAKIVEQCIFKSQIQRKLCSIVV